jgi:hypothetical protein
MATEYLNEGAVTFAAAGWDGSGIADSNDYIVNIPFGPITAGLDQSGLTTGIESMSFMPGSSGIVGGGALGAFIVDADASPDAYVSNRGFVTLNITAGGGSATINNYDCGINSVNNLMGGAFTTITQDGGTLSANASTTFTTYYQMGGASTVEYNASGGTDINITGGTMILKRMPSTLTIGEGAKVIFDPDTAESFTSTTLTLLGGTIVWKAGAIPTVNANGGMVDFSDNKAPFTPGATAFNVSGTKIIEHPAVDLSNIANVGALKRNVGGATPTP